MPSFFINQPLVDQDVKRLFNGHLAGSILDTEILLAWKLVVWMVKIIF